jgi:hypothetical protein
MYSSVVAAFSVLLCVTCTGLVSAQDATVQSENTPIERSTEGLDTAWQDDLKSALAESKRTGKPLLVISILGDLKRRC